MSNTAVDLVLGGRVQGVGFRPFVYRLAHELNLKGWVRNNVGRVEIHAEGDKDKLEEFRHALILQAPPLSQPEIEHESPSDYEEVSGFRILRSNDSGLASIHVPPDQAMCAQCEQEFLNPSDRRYRYPFINCTQCGPRYTIIESMPYDRVNTSMADFPLCDPCRSEYETPENRRFHAEPNACSICGPELTFEDNHISINGNQEALAAAADALHKGKIVAVKGVGGYHLMCDAANEVAVMRLRRNKHRPHKPLAVLAPYAGNDGLGVVNQLVVVNEKSAHSLLSQARPIILMPKRPDAPVCDEIAPDLNELGVMLPPSPLHHALAADFGKTLVATSGNISGEPVLTDDDEALDRLDFIAEGWLQHNRRIVRPADDNVQRVIHGVPRMIRLGRGTAPVEHKLKIPVKQPVLAVGGHLKNTVSLAWEDRLVVSPHMGDLSAHRSMKVFRQVIDDLQRLYHVRAESLIIDSHPHYSSSRWARNTDLPLFMVQHHRAHASSLAGEHNRLGRDTGHTGLVFTWDGVGLGDDNTLWGGETFLGSPANWQRVASFRNFRLGGGDRVSYEPWRSAAALYWELDLEYPGTQEEKLLRSAWERGLNTINNSAAGRLFDAAAAILGLVHKTSHEGEAPMRLEAIATHIPSSESLPLINDDGLVRIDWEPLFHLLKETQRSETDRASLFHRILANTICDIATRYHEEGQIDYVGLSGGVFQNRLLSELVVESLRKQHIHYLLPENIPANDGGLSYGQVIEFSASDANADR